MTRTPGRVPLLVLAVHLLVPTPAHAWTVFLSMDALPELSGWTSQPDGNSSSSAAVNGGILSLNCTDFWSYRAPASWNNTVSHDAGFRIEFRMRIVNKGSCYPSDDVGVWIHDKTYLTIISIDPDRIYVSYPANGAPYYSLDATVFHAYTIVGQGTHRLISVDGTLVLDYDQPSPGGGTLGFRFGDLGHDAPPGCGPSQTEWDYVAYDTQGVVPVSMTSWGKLKSIYRGGR